MTSWSQLKESQTLAFVSDWDSLSQEILWPQPREWLLHGQIASQFAELSLGQRRIGPVWKLLEEASV